MKKMSILELALCALFASLSAILSQISISIGPVPINLAHVSIFISAGLLGAKLGTISQFVFVLLGAVGIPVFSEFSGGLGIILGPTGGFIIGYIGCAFVTGLIINQFGKSMIVLMLATYAGWIVTYIFGVSWYIYYVKTNLMAALFVCMFPFLLGDVAKSILSAILINRLRPIFQNMLKNSI